VCLDLHYDSMSQAYDNYFSPSMRAEMVRALETSASIWRESINVSVEAYKASEILTIMLQKLKDQSVDYKNQAQRSTGQSVGVSGVDNRTTAEVFQAFDDNLQPEHSAAMTLGMLSSGGLTPNTAALFNGSMPATDFAMGEAGVGGTGMTPNYGGMDIPLGSGLNGAASPFSQVFGSGMRTGANGMTEMPLDWVRFAPEFESTVINEVFTNLQIGGMGLLYPEWKYA
jgi:hypothetical protein